ncbi:Calycin [Cinara cedri]|uniref:Calycin n=1 Tax=Cinara cedri TaxID=506608 RepID=A0A5E4MVV9_9HEMI|nr:Calycin [Cinara cedri]
MYRPDSDNRIMYRLLQALFAVYCLAQVARMSSADNVNSSEFDKCDKVIPQSSIKMSKVTGRWYVIETIHHKLINDQRRSLYPRVTLLELLWCPYIDLSYANKHTLEDLKLLWEEEKGNIEYRFKINDMDSPGTWISSGAQNGSLVDEGYKQFAGTVFVRKAVNDHMWLQFCSPNTYLYSVVLSRQKWLDPKVVTSIIKLMDIQNLPIMLRTQTCKSSSSTARATIWLTVAVTVLCFRLSDLTYKTY